MEAPSTEEEGGAELTRKRKREEGPAVPGKHASPSGRPWGSLAPSSSSPVRARLPITPIPPERFYGLDIKKEKDDDEWQKTLEALRKPVGDTYAEFSRQELAFKFIDGKPGEGLHLFAKERQRDGESGLRTYVVTTYKEFWNRYISMPEEHRNYYEVIREGTCCNLYFDIEFLKAENPHIVAGNHEDDLMKAFMKLIGREIQLFFSLPFRVRRRHFIDLDSSDDRKFSRHLILRLPDNYAFINNVHCGHFIKMVHHKLCLLRQLRSQEAERKAQRERERQEESKDNEEEEDVNDDERYVARDKNDINDELLDRLFVRTDKGKEAFIVDMGVYTRNRNFRLIYSTKMGKRLFLRPSSINRYTPPAQTDHPPNGQTTVLTGKVKVEVKEEKEEDVTSELSVDNHAESLQLSYAWFLSSLVSRVGEGKETDATKAYLLSCEPVPSEDGRGVLFYAHYLTPVTLPPNLVLGIFMAPTTSSTSAPYQATTSGNIPLLTFSPPPTSSIPSRIRPPPLSRVTPECSPNPDPSSPSSALYSPSFSSPYQPALPFYALPTPRTFSPPSSSSSSSTTSSSFGSGFPAIDDRVAAHVGGERPGKCGRIRSARRWGDLIVYNITSNRYCENIGREHKSNHIMIIVDLRSGTFYQKCYDPDCQSIDYRSPSYPLPPDICPIITTEQPALSLQMPNTQDADDFLSDDVLYEAILQDPSVWP